MVEIESSADASRVTTILTFLPLQRKQVVQNDLVTGQQSNLHVVIYAMGSHTLQEFGHCVICIDFSLFTNKQNNWLLSAS